MIHVNTTRNGEEQFGTTSNLKAASVNVTTLSTKLKVVSPSKYFQYPKI